MLASLLIWPGAQFSVEANNRVNLGMCGMNKKAGAVSYGVFMQGDLRPGTFPRLV